jgi:hypothetical protein
LQNTLRYKKKGNFVLEQAMKAQRRSGGITLLFFFNLGARWGGWLKTRSGRLCPGKDLVIHNSFKSMTSKEHQHNGKSSISRAESTASFENATIV